MDLTFHAGESTVTARVYPRGGSRWRVDLPDGPGDLSADGGSWMLDGVKLAISTARHGGGITVFRDGASHTLELIDPFAPRSSGEEAGGRLTAPMPGRIVQVTTEPGAEVRRGDPLLVLEAMKMEYTISAPADGTVEAVRYGTGDVVEEGAELIAFTPAGAKA